VYVTGDAFLLWIRDAKLAANLAREKVGDFGVPWKRGSAARIGEIDVFAMLCPLIGENTSEPRQVPNELSPLHLYLDLFDHDLTFGEFG
jgi:hypothetical protein